MTSLELDGTLIVRACKGAKVHIHGLKVTNQGWTFNAVDDSGLRDA